MTLAERFEPLIARLRAKPPVPAAIGEASSQYWSYLTGDLAESIRNGGTGDEIFTGESNFIDFGMVTDVLEGGLRLAAAAREGEPSAPFLRFQYMTEWLAETITKLNKGDRKEVLERDIGSAQADIGHKNEEIREMQAARREILSSSANPPAQSQLAALDQLDQSSLDSIRTRRSVSRGVFLSVQQRREHAAREQALEKQRSRSQSLYQALTPEERARAQGVNKTIEEAYAKIADLEESIRRMEEESRNIDLNEKLSPNEMANRLTSEIEYVRDLTKLTAKRLHLQSCPLLCGGEAHFTKKLLGECLGRMMEFDPKVFQNERVSFHGRPSALLVPGTGNALYDWKNNRFIVPLCPPAGDHISSLAAGIIEYRIDVDEEKEMVKSYNQIMEYREIRSILKLRAQFTKDYTIWMTSEYLGNRILSKGVKDWFEHRIAPGRAEAMTPPDLHEFLLSSDEFRAQCTDMDARLAREPTSIPDEDLWKGSVINYQQGKYEICADLLERLLVRQPDHSFAYYNLGQVSMKTMNRQRALWAFGEFCKRKPQSWWARVARDHSQRLMRG